MNFRLLAHELRCGPIFFLKIRMQNGGAFIVKKISLASLALVLMPFSLLLYFLRWRYCDFYSNRIGHQVAEYFYAISIKEKFKPFTLFEKVAANKHIYEYYEDVKVLSLIEPFKVIIRALYIWPWLRLDVENSIRTNKFKIYDIKNNHHKKFSLVEAHKKKQNELLEKLNLNIKKYICLHVRMKGFTQIDDERFEYRNSTFENFGKVINYCNLRGLQVVIVGDPNQFDCSRVINYPNTIHKSEINDLILIDGAKYFIGNTSGLHLVAWAFNIEVLLLNMIPFHSEPYFKDIKFIRKNLVFKKIIKPQEMQILDSAYHSDIFKKLETDVVENTEKQILNFVKRYIK